MSQTIEQSAATTPATRERVFSGIQPSGASHLGNYLGAQATFVALQEQYEAIYAIVE
jgi:tryptophanyl-tRNA synthetase